MKHFSPSAFQTRLVYVGVKTVPSGGRKITTHRVITIKPRLAKCTERQAQSDNVSPLCGPEPPEDLHLFKLLTRQKKLTDNICAPGDKACNY
jgi:hypothetical protein